MKSLKLEGKDIHTTEMASSTSFIVVDFKRKGISSIKYFATFSQL